MFLLRKLLLALCVLTGAALSASAQESPSDSLERVLAKTVAPRLRIQLLLDLKDLNEDSNLNIPFSIQLFREAAAIGDIYAMGVAIVPIVNRYAPYPERVDSLQYYIRTLRSATRGTPQEGLLDYIGMAVGFNRLHYAHTHEQRLAKARETRIWSDSLSAGPETPSQRAKRLLLLGYAEGIFAQNKTSGIVRKQVRLWEEAYALTHRIEDITVRNYFANIIFFGLSNAYNDLRRYDDQLRLVEDYIETLDAFYEADKASGRRRYLYADNSYVRPYRQLIRGALQIGRRDLAEAHFHSLRERLLAARGENLVRNKTYLYEAGYLFEGLKGEYDRSIRYNDSLLYLIENGKGYFRNIPEKIYQTNRDRGVLLYRAGRYRESFASYAHTARIQDSLFRNEHRERSQTILRRHEMDRLQLERTRTEIRNHLTAIFSFVALAMLMFGTGVYLFRMWIGNRRLQRDIMRHSRKASESERMKSLFVNRICRGIGPPLDEIDRTLTSLMNVGTEAGARHTLLNSIRRSTEMMLSALDNMLEAANLDSLTDHLQTEPTDVAEICRAELLTTSRLYANPQVDYRVESPDTSCIVRTHPKYFAFVVRALLDNAGKATRAGSVALRCEADEETHTFRVTVTDTGCGIPPERREEIFQPMNDTAAASRGLSLPLCRIIAGHLAGTIRLDDSYGPGARFVFTIPLEP